MQNYIDYWKVEKPIKFENFTVEIGFGSGDYLLMLAQEKREEVFFGIEKSWIPVNKLIKKLQKNGLNNVFCTKLDAYWAFQLLFKDRSVKHIIMNYPDPWFKKSHEEKRLTKRENLYIYAKKLISQGEIRIRTDDYPFVDFTLNECSTLKCFSVTVSNPKITEPVTKYEKRWLSMGKSIWNVVLKKEKDPMLMKIREIKEAKNLFPVKIEKEELNIKKISNREFRIDDGLYLKCFSVWNRGEDYAVELLLSENSFTQAFMVTIKKKRYYFIMDVSPFSEILKTEGVKKVLDFFGKILTEEIE